MKYKYQILFVLFAIALVGSIILSFIPVPTICYQNKGCDSVLTSKYNTLLGVKNSYYGVFAFFAILAIIYSHITNPKKIKKNLIHLGVFASSLIALYFLYIQVFVLNAYCKYCLATDFSVIISLLVVIIYWKK